MYQSERYLLKRSIRSPSDNLTDHDAVQQPLHKHFFKCLVCVKILKRSPNKMSLTETKSRHTHTGLSLQPNLFQWFPFKIWNEAKNGPVWCQLKCFCLQGDDQVSIFLSSGHALEIECQRTQNMPFCSLRKSQRHAIYCYFSPPLLLGYFWSWVMFFSL